MYGWRARIGLITPPDNLVIEPELSSITPPGVSLHSTRLSTIDVHQLPIEARDEAESFGGMDIDALAYACNLSSFYEGPGSDEEIAEDLCEASGIPTTTASTAMVRALEAVDVETPAVVTPYDDADNERLRTFLEGNGVAAVSMSGLGLSASSMDDVARISDQSPEETYRRVVATDVPDADGVLVTATNLASIDVVEQMEADLEKPVVSANQALLWDSLRLAGVAPEQSAAGRLFSQS